MKSARDKILAEIQSRLRPPADLEAPPVQLDFLTRTREELLASFLSEVKVVGGKTFVAADAAAARQYLEHLASEKGGEVVWARRPTVESLGLNGPSFHPPRFHPQGSFAAENATLSITAADYALADTGTLVVFAVAGEGRTLSLLAPVNACLVPASRIISTLAELFTLEPELAARASAMVLITGPSRTADIELTLTVGVHGPGELHVVVQAWA